MSILQSLLHTHVGTKLLVKVQTDLLNYVISHQHLLYKENLWCHSYKVDPVLSQVGKRTAQGGQPVQGVLPLDGLPQLPVDQVTSGEIKLWVILDGASMPRVTPNPRPPIRS